MSSFARACLSRQINSTLNVAKLNGGSAEVDACLGMLADWPYAPLRSHSNWRTGSVSSLARARMAGALTAHDASVIVLTDSTVQHGFAVLKDLAWDTSLLGMKAARLDALVSIGDFDRQLANKRLLLSAVQQEAVRRGIEHISARVDGADISSLHALEESGFITIDGILTLALSLDGVDLPEDPAGLALRLATTDDAADVESLGRTAYTIDRFHSDPAIARDIADTVNATWARNSVLGVAADATVVARDEKGLLGFVTCKLQRDTAQHLGALIGTIVLVATAERARGRGIGISMTMKALRWFKESGCKFVDVGTQMANIPASRLYESAGFRMVGSSVSLRWTPAR